MNEREGIRHAEEILVFHELRPALELTRNFGKVLFPDDLLGDEAVEWINAAIYGVCAQFLSKDSADPDLEQLVNLYGSVCDVINTTVDRYGGLDLEQYAQDFLEQHAQDFLVDVALHELIEGAGGKMPEGGSP